MGTPVYDPYGQVNRIREIEYRYVMIPYLMDQSLPGLSVLTIEHALWGRSCATELIQTQNCEVTTVVLVQIIPSVIDQYFWNKYRLTQKRAGNQNPNQNQIKT